VFFAPRPHILKALCGTDLLAPLDQKYHDSTDSVDKFTTWLAQQPYITSDQPPWLVCHDDWMMLMTAVGRTYRDVQQSVDAELGDDTLYVGSSLGIAQLDTLNVVLKELTSTLSNYST
jgi:hypothetical protein